VSGAPRDEQQVGSRSARTGSGSRSAEYVALELELDALRILRNDRAVADAAMSEALAFESIALPRQ
jgi:hypothetical protein